MIPKDIVKQALRIYFHLDKDLPVWVASLVISLILTGCENNAGKAGQSTGAADQYQLKQVDRQVKDEHAPVGHWEQNLTYPEVTKGGTPAGRSKVNEAIERHVDRFRCEEPGDLSFDSQVRYVNELVVSFTYSAMWMCPGMPHPDSASGAFNANLNTGERIRLENELKNRAAADTLAEEILAGLNQAIKNNETELDCGPAEDWRQFYLTAHDFVFTYASPVHGRTPCDADFEVPREQMRAYLREDSILLNMT